ARGHGPSAEPRPACSEGQHAVSPAIAKSPASPITTLRVRFNFINFLTVKCKRFARVDGFLAECRFGVAFVTFCTPKSAFAGAARRDTWRRMCRLAAPRITRRRDRKSTRL